VTRRLVGVLTVRAEFPVGELRAAMVEDVYETVAGLALVEPAMVLVRGDPDAEALAGLTWPGTAVLSVTAAGSPLAAALAGLAALAARAGPRDGGGDGEDGGQGGQVTVVAGDAPDLPGLLVGKLHRALGAAEVAVLPAAGGGLVALATRVPVAPWVVAAGVDLDTADAVARLRAAAPRRTTVSVGPGWHRVRSAADLATLDPGLEGWEVTRAVLAR
jgi:hypothetical protein